MMKLLLGMSGLFVLTGAHAQFKVQGAPYVLQGEYTSLQPRMSLKSAANETEFTFEQIQFWTGQGANESALAVQWNTGTEQNALVWGFRWDGKATGETLVRAVAKADPRFFIMAEVGTPYGSAIGGYGYDANGDGKFSIVKDGVEYFPDENGVFSADGYGYDGYQAKDPEDYWSGGWNEGYWSYWVKDIYSDPWGYSNFGISNRNLSNGNWDGWNFAADMQPSDWLPLAPAPVPTPEPEPTVPTYWIGEGENEASIAISWQDSKEPEMQLWGYRWADQQPTLQQVLKKIVETDPRLFAVVCESEQTVGGIGFDLNGKNTIAMVLSGDTKYPKYSQTGLFETSAANINQWVPVDVEDHWNAPTSTQDLHWSCYRKDAKQWEKLPASMPTTLLVDGDCINWVFDANSWTTWQDASQYTPTAPYVKPVVDYTNGFFVVNEDWFGWDNGTVNFITDSHEMIYRAYRRENEGQTFGVTTQHGTIYGDNFYIVSKQADKSATDANGGRLVVADAKTMKKKTSIADLNGGDGRSFIGVSPDFGYIGTSKEILLFDITSLTVGEVIEGSSSSSYGGQIGSMIRIGDYVFAVKQSVGVLVIDTKLHQVIETIDIPSASMMTVAKDGKAWVAVAGENKLVSIDPSTFETDEIVCPDGVKISSSWGAWNAGDLCAGDQENTLFFATGKGFSMSQIVKYDIDANTFDPSFFTLPNQDQANKQVFYGAGMRVDPLTNQIVITATQSGWGANFKNNWIHLVDASTGELTKSIIPESYYWFPAIPVFTDRFEPEITLPSQVVVNKPEQIIPINTLCSDRDQMDASICIVAVSDNDQIVEAKVVYPNLVLRSVAVGETTVQLAVESNGQVVESTLSVKVVSDVSLNESTQVEQAKVYPTTAYQSLHVEAARGADVRIFSTQGELIKQWIQPTTIHSVDVSSWSSGVYVVRITSDDKIHNQRIVKH